MAKRAKAIPGPTEADLRELPEITDEEWSALREQRRKRPITVRLDGDIINWLKGKEEKYQTAMNRVLRFAMQQDQARKTQKTKRRAS